MREAIIRAIVDLNELHRRCLLPQEEIDIRKAHDDLVEIRDTICQLCDEEKIPIPPLRPIANCADYGREALYELANSSCVAYFIVDLDNEYAYCDEVCFVSFETLAVPKIWEDSRLAQLLARNK